MPHLYGFNFLFNAIFHHGIPEFSGELQQQEVHCQQPRAACQKPRRIDVPAGFLSSINLQAFGKPMTVTLAQSLWMTPSCQCLQLRRQWTYKLLRTCPKAANRSPQAPSLHNWPWVYSAAHFEVFFIFNSANGKPLRPIGAKGGHLLFEHGRFHLLPTGHGQGQVEYQSGK